MMTIVQALLDDRKKTGPTEMLSSNPNVIPLSKASSMNQSAMSKYDIANFT